MTQAYRREHVKRRLLQPGIELRVNDIRHRASYNDEELLMQSDS
jgi:hypothetical protein